MYDMILRPSCPRTSSTPSSRLIAARVSLAVKGLPAARVSPRVSPVASLGLAANPRLAAKVERKARRVNKCPCKWIVHEAHRWIVNSHLIINPDVNSHSIVNLDVNSHSIVNWDVNSHSIDHEAHHWIVNSERYL